MTKPRILFSETHFKAPKGDGTTFERTASVDWWRNIVPANYVKSHTDWKVETRKGAIDPFLENQPAEIGWQEVGSAFDILQASYQDHAIAYAFIQATNARHGLIHSMDVDDDIFHIEPFNPVMIEYQNKPEKFQAMLTILRHAPILTCTNGHLKDQLKESRGKKEDDITVIPNLVDLDTYPTGPIQKKPKERLKIGYIGGSTHLGDFIYRNADFWGALSFILGKYHDKVELEILGLFPDMITKDFPHYTWRPGSSDVYEYFKLLREHTFDWDIAVAPLEDSLFNDSKSNIKWIESSMVGAAFVGQQDTPYNCVINGKTGFTCGSMKQYIDAFEALINNAQLRYNIVEAARKQIATNYSIQAKGDLWVKHFERLMKQKEKR